MTDKEQEEQQRQGEVCHELLVRLKILYIEAFVYVQSRPEMTEKESVKVVAWDLARAWLQYDVDATLGRFMIERKVLTDG